MGHNLEDPLNPGYLSDSDMWAHILGYGQSKASPLLGYELTFIPSNSLRVGSRINTGICKLHVEAGLFRSRWKWFVEVVLDGEWLVEIFLEIGWF